MTRFLAHPGDSVEGAIDPREPRRGLGLLMASIVPTNVALFLVYGAVPAILLPQQVADRLGEADKVANLAVITSIAAAAAMLAQPIAGQLSDRTRSRWGRRGPWIVVGALIGSVALGGLAAAGSLVGMLVAWVIAQIALNCAQGPLSAILPDRVPVARRGSFAALSGVGLMVGTLGGSILGSLFLDDLTAGYLICAGVVAAALVGFVVVNPDHSSADQQSVPWGLRDLRSVLWVDPRRHPDFCWAFLGRLLLFTGSFSVLGYQLFILTDYLGIDEPEAVLPALGLTSVVGVVVSTAVAGPLSDRIGRRKPFVAVSSGLAGCGFVVPWIWPTLTGWFVMTVVVSLALGTFLAVDQALMSEVLPSADSFGKDLGVINIAATLPQAIAPALAGVIVTFTGFSGLFPIAIVLSLLAAVAVRPIRSVA